MEGQGRLEDHLGTLELRFDVAPPSLEARPEIFRLRAQGYGPTAIARSLNRRRIATPTGRGRWWPETVKRHTDPHAWAEYMRAYRARVG